MPLIKSGSKEARATNIREMIDSGYPPRQAVAASYANQRRHSPRGKRRSRRGRRS